jgi:hypothetical protein
MVVRGRALTSNRQPAEEAHVSARGAGGGDDAFRLGADVWLGHSAGISL